MSEPHALRRPEGVKVTYRRVKFDFEDQGFDRYWLAGSPFKSLFWTQLSTAFELEHFTAGFADEFLQRPWLSEGGDPKVVALWAWHAAEEAEHRATCYDLYERLGGTYRQRVTILIGAWAAILAAAAVNTAALLWKDGKLFTLDTLRGLGYLLGSRGLITGLGPGFAAYFRRDFHPWQGVDGSATARWEAENRRYIRNVTEVARAN